MTYNLRGCSRQNPVIWIALIAVASVRGNRFPTLRPALPGFIAAYAGDTLWTLAAFVGIGLILSRASTRTIAGPWLVASIKFSAG